MARVRLHFDGLNERSLRVLLAGCSSNREAFHPDGGGRPTWMPVVSVEGPVKYSAQTAAVDVTTALLILSEVDGA